LVIKADPDWPIDNQVTPDVEFTPPSGYRPGREAEGQFREYRDGVLLFKAPYATRGPYSD
jgi:hypothetical protein